MSCALRLIDAISMSVYLLVFVHGAIAVIDL